jgi:hypothetical protein
MEKCEHQKVSKQSGKRTYASKYLGNCHPNYVGFNSVRGPTDTDEWSIAVSLSGRV